MAYFSNGTEGEAYEGNICERCAHYKDGGDGETCPVWMVHLLYNYSAEGSETQAILDTLIPRRGIYNDLCAMFVPSKPEFADLGERYKAWIDGKLARPANEQEHRDA